MLEPKKAAMKNTILQNQNKQQRSHDLRHQTTNKQKHQTTKHMQANL
jgi:hypothetical protein